MPLKWFPAFSVCSPRSWAVEEEKVWLLNHTGHSKALQAQLWVCRRGNLDIFYQRIFGTRLPKVSCCLHPWLDRALVDQVSGWGEPFFSRRSMWCCTFSVPGIPWGQLQPSAQPPYQRSRKNQTWLLTLSQLKGPCGLLSQAELAQPWTSMAITPRLWPPPHPLTHPFPVSRSPEKVFCTTSPVRCSAAELFSQPSFFKEQTSSLLKWLKLLTKVPWGCWQKPRRSLSA